MSKKVLVLSTRDFGGAGESAFRITEGMRKLGVDARMLVRHKAKPDQFVTQAHVPQKAFLARAFDKLKRTVRRDTPLNIELDYDYSFFNIDETKSFIKPADLIHQLPFKPDIILLCWVTDFINATLALQLKQATGAQMYWLMTDMAPLTGGCHYAWDCKGYEQHCSNCPAILTNEYKYLAKRNFAIKEAAVRKGDIKVIAGSLWTHNQARRSTLFRHQPSIPVLNGIIDFSLYNANARAVAKQVFGIESDAKIVFTGTTLTTERRKGIKQFVEALSIMWDRLPEAVRSKVGVLIAGNGLEKNDLVEKIPFKKHFISFIKDERLLALAYQAADVFVCSSLEDSGPMMVNEAMACGTPVVGFELGFAYDMITNGKNGFKAPVGDSVAMAEGIMQIITLSKEEFNEYSARATGQVQNKVGLQALENLVKEL